MTFVPRISQGRAAAQGRRQDQRRRPHGRHEIFAGGKKVGLAAADHSLVLREELVTKEEQHDLDRLGIAKTARDEKLRARDAQMAKLYRKYVLKDETPDLVQIQAPKPEREEVGSFGD